MHAGEDGKEEEGESSHSSSIPSFPSLRCRPSLLSTVRDNETTGDESGSIPKLSLTPPMGAGKIL